MQSSFLQKLDQFNDKYGEWIFYMGLFLMIVGKYWFSFGDDCPHEIVVLRKLLLNTGILLLIVRILLFVRKYPLYVFCCIILYPIFKLSYSLSNWYVILYSFIIIAASRDANIKNILRVFLAAFCIILISGPLLYSVGWLSDITKQRLDYRAHSFGFTSPNTLACLIQMLALLVLLYGNIKQTKIIWIVCWATALLIGILTLGISSAVILILIPIIYLCLKHYSFPAWILALLPWCFLLMSIALAYYYGPSYGENTFESRFSIPALVYQNHGLSLFGQEYGYVSFTQEWETGIRSLCVDNVYMHIVLCEGVMIALLVLLFLSHYFYRIGRMGQPLLTASAIGLGLFGLMEYITLDASFNFLLLYYFHQFTPFSKPIQRRLAIAVIGLGLMAVIYFIITNR